MTQNQLDRLVARATGETVSEIRHLGFSIADPTFVEHDPEPADFPELLLDWDDVALRRNTSYLPQPQSCHYREPAGVA